MLCGIEPLKVVSRQDAVAKAGAYALVAKMLGLPIQNMALVEDKKGITGLVSGLYDDIVTILKSPVPADRVELLEEYLQVIIAGIAVFENDIDAEEIQEKLLNIIAQYRLPLLEEMTDEKERATINLFCENEKKAKDIIKNNAYIMQSIATGLNDCNSLSEDEIQRLIDKSIRDRNKRLVIFPCKDSFEINKRFGLCYEPILYPCKDHNAYIGISNGTSFAVGKIETVMSCERVGNSIFPTVESGTESDDSRQRVIDAMDTIPHHNLTTTPLRFYLADEFIDTDLRKISSGNLMGPRYYDLSEIVGADYDVYADYTSVEVANLLDGKTFV